MARPIEFTDDVVRKLEEVFSLDGTVGEACFYADISRDTYYRHIKEKPELSDRFEEIRNRPILKARQTVVKSLDDPDRAFRYLERKRRGEFAMRIEQTGADGKDLIPDNAGVVSELTNKLNELYKRGSSPSDGRTSSTMGTETQDKE